MLLYSFDILFGQNILSVVGHPELPPYAPAPASANAPPNPNFGQTNYGFDNSGTPGSYPMNLPAGNQPSYGYAGPASNYSNVVVSIYFAQLYINYG